MLRHLTNVPAIVESAVDIVAAERRCKKALSAVEDAERAEEKAAEVHGNKTRLARVELGRELIEARKAWPARGPKAKGWGEFLRELGIQERTAERYMHLADPVKQISDTSAPVSEISPGHGTKKRRRKPRPSTEVCDSDEDYEDDNPDWAKAEASAPPQDQLGAFLIRADQAARFAFYAGPVSNNELAMVRRVLEVWTKLLGKMEGKYNG